jgi:hypothetical protein
MIGCDIGQVVDPTAIVIAEPVERPTGKKIERNRVAVGAGFSLDIEDEIATYYLVRHLERLPLGTAYPEVARHLAELVGTLRMRQDEEDATPPPWARKVRVFADATGVGRPVVDLLRSALRGVRNVSLTAVSITGTDHREGGFGSHEIRVGKAYLTSRLQALLQTHRIKLPETEAAQALADELRDFEIRVSDRGTFGAGARPGHHDDLVIALALATLEEPRLARIRRGRSPWTGRLPKDRKEVTS